MPKATTKAKAKTFTSIHDATDVVKLSKLNQARQSNVVNLETGQFIRMSSQIGTVEAIIQAIINEFEIPLNGHSVGYQYSTGRYAKCYGLNTVMRRLDDGSPVVGITQHIGAFELLSDDQRDSKLNFALSLVEPLAHAEVACNSIESGKLEFGVALSGVHNSKFAEAFASYGTTTPADRKNTAKQHRPIKLHKKFEDWFLGLNIDWSAIMLTGATLERPTRAKSKTGGYACTNPEHWETSNVPQQWRGNKQPIKRLACDAKVGMEPDDVCGEVLTTKAFKDNKPKK